MIVVISENLSEITAGSLMVETPIISVRRPISPGLIKDLFCSFAISEVFGHNGMI